MALCCSAACHVAGAAENSEEESCEADLAAITTHDIPFAVFELKDEVS